MNSRRSFFAAALAAVASLIPGQSKRRPKPGTVPNVERGPHGDCLARIYRLDTDGFYYEIDRQAVRPGDRCIRFGLDGTRLWLADAFTVGKDDAGRGCGVDENGYDYVYVEDTMDLFHPEWPQVIQCESELAGDTDAVAENQ